MLGMCNLSKKASYLAHERHGGVVWCSVGADKEISVLGLSGKGVSGLFL